MTCTYRFVGTDGKQTVIKGQAAFKAFLADGGLEQFNIKVPEAPSFQRRQGKVLERIPELEAAAQGLKEGTVTREQYEKLVNKLKPVTPYAEVPTPATTADMERGLTSDKVERIGVPMDTLKAGDPVGLRLDIPAYANHGVWVVSVHEQEAGYAAGKSIGYESVAAVTKPTFGVVEKAAMAIAGGKPKATIAVMKGDWKPVTPKQASTAAKAALKSGNWVQVGMDPTRHAYFYDRANMEPVVSADEAIQIGPLVLAKNPVYGKKSDFAFSRRQAGAEMMGINVNQDGDNAYADKIIDGEKTIETRASDSLRPYVGKRVAIVRTGAGPAKAIGEVTIGEPIVVKTQKEFDSYRDQTLVPKGSKFDIAPGGVKYLYPLSNPIRYKQERDVGAGIVARRIVEPKLSRRQKIREAADAIAKMDPDVRDDTQLGDFPGAASGYMLYEARVMLKKPSDKLKRVNENNSFALWQQFDFIANVDGEHFGIAKQEDPDEPDDETKFVYSFEPLDNPDGGAVTTTDQTDELFKEMRASLGAAPAFSRRQPMGRETEGWILSRDEVGRFRFGAGAKAYRYAADVANLVLDKLGLKPVSPELGRAMRKMKAEVERAQRLTVTVAEKLKELPEQERQMISDVIEGELKRGTKPPKHVLELAASLQSIMSEQSAELVRLGMLSPEAAGRWDGKYLPRFYEQKLGDEVKAWAKAAKALLGRKKTMQGIGGSSLKSRGMFELINTEDLQDWLDEGWEVRDAEFDPATDETVTVWRDYTRQERDDMGEIRDAMFRFVMGYNKSQRDIALGRLYESLADNYASKKEKPGYVKVPDTKIEDTMARRYGKLAGKWVPAEVMDHLSAFDDSQRSELIKMYLKGLSMWKEGKTVLNPVSHANNVLSNLTMAHFAGISYWDIGKYAGAMRDLIKKTPMVEEAVDAGLFGGTFNQAELLDQMPPQLKALAGMSESRLKRGVDTTWNVMSWFLRKPAATAYQAEDQFFRYLIYRDARQRGLDVEDAIDYSQNYIFTYDDLPKTARALRDFALPFFAYTYKVVPPLVNTALEKPWRYAAPAAALYTVNALMYAMAASLGGGDDEDWWTVIRRYATDPEFRDKARALEDQERENLPPWMKGFSATLATPKAIRLGMDDVTNLPVFLDVSRVFPGGDLLDAHANAGGVPLLQPITPSNPVLNTLGVMLWNKDSFFGKDIVDQTDTAAEATAKRAKWAWQQFSPAVAIGNYHWDRALNVIANQTGQPVLGYTGINKDGLPAQLGYTAAQTVGIKIRPIDLELSAAIRESEQKRLMRDLDTKIRKIERLEKKGAITGEAAEAETEKLKQKKEFLREGLTVEGEERK